MGTGASSNSLRSTANTAVSTTKWKRNARSTTSNLAPAGKETSRASSQKDLKAEDRYFKQHSKNIVSGVLEIFSKWRTTVHHGQSYSETRQCLSKILIELLK